MMSEKPELQGNECMCVDIPKALYTRVEAYCKNNEIPIAEFIFDALSEKLMSVHKEKRKKPRL
ncbi:MAG: hypothetical protein HKP58_17640 [Desulfatitalea sp.]|nr:hypothetical protein [Desulfatitalea sp.]